MVESLLSDDFTFSSPYDDHINKAKYSERCWPNSERIRIHHIEKVIESGDEAFVLYVCELKSELKFRNTKYLVFESGKIKQVEVYFGDRPMTGANSKAAVEAEIRALIEKRIEAVRARDVEGAMASIAPDFVSFDVVNPLRYLGSAAARQRAEAWFSSFKGPIGYEMRDLAIGAGEDTAFSHILNRYSGTKTDGGRIDMWVRVTACYRRIEGRWMITHEHNSVPFDVESGQASLDLKP